jgi:hypothetical protein
MDEVTNSSSQVGSSVSQTTQTFDVSDESHLLKLLNYIRRGPFDQDQKGKLRDVVLDYATTKDEKVLTLVATALSAKRVSLTKNGTPLSVGAAESGGTDLTDQIPQTVTSSYQAGFPSSRPSPSFSAPRVNVAATPASIIPEPVVEKQESVMTPVEPLIEKKLEVTPDEPAPPSPGPDESVVPIVQQSVPEVSAPVPIVETPPATPTPASVNPNAPSRLLRIKEIKRLVNEKVGNPVNLVDANNIVGREYMNALLDAMRVLNGGNVEDTQLTMQRLETAYQSVMQSIESGETVIGQPEVQQSPVLETPAASPVPAQTPGPDAPTQAPTALPDPISTFKPTLGQVNRPPITPNPAPAPAVSAPAPSQTASAVAAPVSENSAVDDAPVTDEILVSRPEPIVAVKTPEPTPMQNLASEAKLEPKAVPVPVPAETPAQGNSLADMLQQEKTVQENILHTNAEALAASAPENSSDPLQSPEVSAGLQQLLSEWKLFKSSGVFGIGPSGSDHPLYATLRALPMAAVISGRFEGSSPENKQSLVDYMNGWRYEYSIVHEMNETFEQYLRRVIREVLDRQKATPAT